MSNAGKSRIAVVFDFDRGAANIVLASEKDRFDLSSCEWANNEQLLCGYYAVYREAYLLLPSTRVVAVNPDGSDLRVLMERKLRGTFTQFQDRIIDWLPEDPQHVLIIKPDRNGSKVSRLNVYTGGMKSETSSR